MDRSAAAQDPDVPAGGAQPQVERGLPRRRSGSAALSARMEALSAAPATLSEAAALLPVLRAECATLLATLGLGETEEGTRLSLDTGEYGRS